MFIISHNTKRHIATILHARVAPFTPAHEPVRSVNKIKLEYLQVLWRAANASQDSCSPDRMHYPILRLLTRRPVPSFQRRGTRASADGIYWKKIFLPYVVEEMVFHCLRRMARPLGFEK
jgi:hypothetical protein